LIKNAFFADTFLTTTIPSNMKKQTVLFLFLGLFIYSSNAQVFNASNRELNKIANIKNSSGWITFKDQVSIDPSTVFDQYKINFGLSANDKMEITRTETDKIGFTHFRYQQTYNGIPVLGGDFIIHAQNGLTKTGNGKIVSGLSLSPNPSVNSDQAVQKAIGFIGAQSYMWENPANEEMLRHITGKTDATYYPSAELVIIDKNFSGIATNYRLAYKVNVYAEQPLSYQDVFVDAQTGAIFHVMNRLRNDDVNGTAVTKYSGTQSFTTDSTGVGAYRLRETGRGNGIETYDMNTGTSYGAAVDFTDTDNYWDNVNAQLDEVATDAHWGAEMTYDYYLNIFGRHSYNDLDGKLVSYVHYDVGYDNAFWDGTKMTYGDGSGTDGPLTSLDVCGHEITHGVTEYSANLIYQNESGALNESFSDMFATAIEFYALSGAGDWYIGEDFDNSGNHGFRDMSDPKLKQQPDTYLGQYWYIGAIDNGGVHTNSGVSNYWFYMLSVGDTGTNDNNHFYSVTGVGIDTAAKIAYYALTNFLTSTSQFEDVRMATLQAAEILYGPCSEPYIQCANAWYAVGIGMAVADNDFSLAAITSPVTACGMTNEAVSVMAIYNGCSVAAQAGDSIWFSYQTDGGAVETSLYILPSNVSSGDTVNYTFPVLTDVSIIGMHSIDAWMHFVKDTLGYNDTIRSYSFENRLYQNVDVGVTNITSPVSSCNLSSAETVIVEIEFFGCDFLPSGSSIKLAYNVNGGPAVYDSIVLSADLYPEVPLSFSFTEPADLTASGTYTLSAWTEFTNDSLTSNDAFNGYLVKKPIVVSDTTVTFDETNTTDFFLVHTTAFSHALVSTAAHNTGVKGFLMTGGNPFQYLSMIELPTGIDTWIVNEFLSARIDFCVDATAWTQANLKFDLKQTFGETIYNLYLGAGDYTIASNFRVLVNETDMIGDTYNPSTGSGDPYTTRFVDLSSYAGTKFTLSFETRNISKDTLGMTMDNAYIDNVSFSELSQFGVEENPGLGDITAYPNPNEGKFWIEYNAEQSGPVTIEVFDHIGQLVYSSQTDLLIGSNKIRMDLGDQPTGIYMIRTSSGNEVHSGKIILE
jgi:Zn-dependent metalloprotease